MSAKFPQPKKPSKELKDQRTPEFLAQIEDARKHAHEPMPEEDRDPGSVYSKATIESMRTGEVPEEIKRAIAKGLWGKKKPQK